LVTQSEPTGSIVTQSLETSIPQLTSTTTISDPALAVKHVTDDLTSQLHGTLYPKLKGVLSNIGQVKYNTINNIIVIISLLL
jgi:hypothetical protein